MGRWQPYIYSSHERDAMDDAFNPKAITMASRQPPPPPKQKQDGPLIDFNKHPDSYLVLPYGKTNVPPMSPQTKLYVKIARATQLVLRLCSLLGAAGLLLCAIFIRGALDTEGWLMRIPPGADIVVCLYAIYHLIRSAKSRPPASSASYHFFALITDVGFIPFYVYTLLLSRRNADMEAGTLGRWRTVFPTDEETDKILLTTWLTATAAASIHLVSLFLDMYLVLIFRKIAALPPDMNPLEDNLTSRKKSKHKHKNSSISAITDDKRFSNGSTIGGQRYSQSDPLLPNDLPSPTKSQVAFMHTRTNSSTTYSPHTPRSAHESKERFSMYSLPGTAHQSRANIQHPDDGSDNETLAQRKSLLAQQANIKRNSRNDSYVTSSSKQDFYTPPSTARSDAPNTGDLALQRSRDTLQNDNWFVHPDDVSDGEADARFLAPQPPRTSKGTTKGYHALSTYDDTTNDYPSPQPLRMNPPTPQPTPPLAPSSSSSKPDLKRHQTTTSISTDATFARAYSRSGTPKSRYYGDLKAAQSPPPSPPKKNVARHQLSDVRPSAVAAYAVNPVANSSAAAGVGASAPFSLDKKSYTSVRRTGEAAYTPVKGVSPRVVSRSGVDYVNPYEFEDSDSEVGAGVGKSRGLGLGMSMAGGRRRDVSGKVAEEGRGREVVY